MQITIMQMYDSGQNSSVVVVVVVVVVAQLMYTGK